MVLVTGGTGLVGAHLLLRLCENGETVRALYRNVSTIEKSRNIFNLHKKGFLFEKIEWHAGDLNDVPSLEPAFINVSEVYHCAALISFDPNDEELLRKINIEGTANIVNLCLAYKVRKLCHVSSVAALGDLNQNQTIVTEDCEWNPEKHHSYYGISKYGAEMEIWRGQQEGLDSVIINPGIILGAGFWEKGSGEIFSRIGKGLRYYTKGITGYVDVDDVTSILVKLMKSEIAGERFVVVAENLPFDQILNLISAALKVKPPSIYATPVMISIAWRIDWLKSALSGKKRAISKDAAKALCAKTFYSSEKAEKNLGFNFKKISDAIDEIVKVQNSK